MQIRCQNCRRPFALGKEFVRQALEQMEADDLNHINVMCPHCRRQNAVTKPELQRSLPAEAKK